MAHVSDCVNALRFALARESADRNQRNFPQTEDWEDADRTINLMSNTELLEALARHEPID